MLRLGVIVLVTSLVGCVADKGDEDNPLGDDGKADSFYKPSSHGQLVFDAPNRAEFTADAQFHEWRFTLSGTATISVRTQLANNLDTVMYMYRRDVGSMGSFGSYIHKNDDHGDDAWSQIDFKGGAGEYRIIVKAYKTSQRGPFSVLGTCDGAGCPAPSACVAEEFDAIPDSAATYSAACATGLLDAFATRTASSSDVALTESEVCTLDGLAKRSVDLFRAYWDDVQGWDDFKSGEADLDLEVTTEVRGMTTEVTVDTAVFDEDAMSFSYGPGGKLLALYQSNQSPDARTFCDETGTIAAPDVTCVEYMRAALPHAAAEKTGSGSTNCNNAITQLPPLVGDPVCEFTGKFGLSGTSSVSYQYRSWSSDGGLLGAQITLTAGSHSGTYYMGTTYRDTTQIFASKLDSTLAFDCREL
jgi:hypothetical protein